MSEKMLRCEVEIGMFSNEKLVTVKTCNGDTQSFFVAAKYVDERHGAVRVQVVGKPKDATCAIIPTAEPNSFVFVSKADLE